MVASAHLAMVAKLGILGSGHGSNMEAIATACQGGQLPADVALVLSDVADAPILDRALERGIAAQAIDPGHFRSKLSDEAERQFIDTLKSAQIDWVILAGFMRIIKSDFLRAFPERIVNIHPSLLPSFPGLNATQQALDYGVGITGTTVHIVDQGIDTGAIIAQEPVRVQPGDTPERLQQRIKETEHQLYPRALTELVTGRIRVTGRTITRST